MSKIDKSYQEISKTVLEKGRVYHNKNRDTKRLQIPSYTFRHEFKDGFPAISTKKLYWTGISGELIWFLRGDNDIKFLKENKIAIWDKDAYNWYVKKYSNNDPIEGQESNYHKNEDGTYRMFTFEEFIELKEGSVGQNYSVQWRNFNGDTDQIKELIDGMKQDIMSSRLKVNAWNPSELDKTALPPCHSEFQVVGVPLSTAERSMIYQKKTTLIPHLHSGQKLKDFLDKEEIPEFGFELHWNQRSVDLFLGLPFNIASYGLLAKILETFTGYPALAIEGTLKCVHFYENQYYAAKELIERDSSKHENCDMSIVYGNMKKDFEEKGLDYVLEQLKPYNFQLLGYEHDEAMKVEMLAPTKI